jgi:hypothetical protein
VELRNQAAAPTLAHQPGDVPHVSGLLRRIAHLLQRFFPDLFLLFSPCG